jgi:CRISPR-associated protein Csd1
MTSPLAALDRYYARMVGRNEAEPPGYSRERIGFAISLSPDGEPVGVAPLVDTTGKKPQGRQVDVPKAVDRSSNIKANFLWDKTAYSLGVTADSRRPPAPRHAAFKALHTELLTDVQDLGLAALLRFLENWAPERFAHWPFEQSMLDANFVFRLNGELSFIHERQEARILHAARSVEGSLGFCLLTGETGPIARLHPFVKNVYGRPGEQPRNRKIVAFDKDAFASWGKEQGANAPTSEAAAHRYGAALNRLLDRGSRNRLQIGDASVVFWAEADGDEAAAAEAEDSFAAWLGVPPPSDAGEAAKIHERLKRIADGRPDPALDLGTAATTRVHVLGLSPNAARLSVRFWLTDTLGAFATRLADHHWALALDPPPVGWGVAPSINLLLVKTVALQEKWDNIPPGLAGEVARAVLAGLPYPRAWLAAAIMRLRAGDPAWRGWHAAALKACLNRSPSEEKLTMGLNPESTSEAYQLGRLFAVLEKAQYAALDSRNTTVADRFYGSASAHPSTSFGPLLRNVQHHLSDLAKRKPGWAHNLRRDMAEIIGRLPPDLPTTLRLEDQGRFAIGYYHQRAYHERAYRRPDEPDTPDTADPTETEGEDQE